MVTWASMITLSPRQQSILNRVVDTHIETAQPVGSHFITHLYTDLYRKSYSPATVRHEMGVLEERGYLTHPHPSAGRIPTDRGYRYYLDHGMAAETLPSEMFEEVTGDLEESVHEMESLAERASMILSKLSDQVSTVLLPARGRQASPYRVFLRGTDRMVEKPEFQDTRKLRALLKVLEDKTDLTHFLTALVEEGGIKIFIGHENTSAALQDCAVVSASIEFHEDSVGVIAVIGPTRMKYSRTIPLVQEMAKTLSRLLYQIPQEF